jgi:hypothetical protein
VKDFRETLRVTMPADGKAGGMIGELGLDHLIALFARGGRQAIEDQMKLARIYEKSHLPLNEATSKVRVLESVSAMDSLESVVVTDKQGNDVLFTPENPFKEASAGLLLGISPYRPNWSCRSVAACLLCARLKVNVVPKTEFAIFKGRVGTAVELPKGWSPRSSEGGASSRSLTQIQDGAGNSPVQIGLMSSQRTSVASRRTTLRNSVRTARSMVLPPSPTTTWHSRG